MESQKSTKLARLLAYAVGAILVLLPFHALLTTWAGSNFGQLDLFRIWKELLLVFLGFGALWLVLTDKNLKKWLKGDVLVKLIGLYVVLHIGIGLYALSAHKVNSEALIYSWIINLRFLVFFLVCMVVAAKSSWLGQNWQKLVIWPAAIVIGFGLLQQFMLPNNFLSHFGYGRETIPAYHTIDHKPDYVRLQSTLRGPNPLGAYLVLVITCVAAYFVAKKHQRMKWGIYLAATATVLFFTYSRSAWVGLAASLILLLYWLLKNSLWRKRLVAVILIGALILTAAIVVLRNNDVAQNTLFHTDENSSSLESTNQVRSQALSNGAKSIVKQPLGRGPGTAGPASFRNDRPPRLAENYYIQIAQEVGIIGLIVFLVINLRVVQLLWRSRNQLLSIVLLASFAGLLLVNMLSHAWADDTLSYIWWGLAGIALSPAIIKQKANVETKKKAKT